MHKKGGSESVKVVIRLRPFSEKENDDKRVKIVKVDEQKGELYVSNPKQQEDNKQFTFDQVYDSTSTQMLVYKNTAFPIVESVLEGYNGTVFAYGQTGTGKTFTMEGKTSPDELKGIMPRAFEHIFKIIESNSADKQFLVRASYLELYNEEIRDLFSKNSKKLEIKERSDTGIYVKDLSTYLVHDAQELSMKLAQGRDNRHVGETYMNRDSSRSHSIMTITVEMSDMFDGQQRFRAGKLNLVDLAGSEKQSKTGAQGDRLKEAININQSLSTLGNVISALVDPKSSHIPYRDSKLTRLLQDSLGGNTKTVMVANIGPVDYNYDETLSTLRYANRAKSIQNKPKINEDPKDAMLRQFQEEIQKLRSQLNNTSDNNIDNNNATNQKIKQIQKVITIPNKQKVEEIEKKIEQEKIEIQKKADAERKKIEEQKNLAEDQKIKLLKALEDQEQKKQQVVEKQKKLMKKIQKMEEKLIQGHEIKQQHLNQERELTKAKEQIELKAQREQEMEEELLAKEIFTRELEKKYNSQKEEVDDKTKKIKLIWQKLKQAETENKELDEFYCQEIDELQNRRRDLLNEFKLKNLIIQYFIPEKELQRLEYLGVQNEESDWMLPNLELSGNMIKNNKEFQQQLLEQKAEGNEMLDMDIYEQENEHDIKELNEHPNVYFVYSEDGLIREEEVAPKKNKQKKQQETKKEQRKASSKKETAIRKASAKKDNTIKKQEDIIPKAKGLIMTKK